MYVYIYTGIHVFQLCIHICGYACIRTCVRTYVRTYQVCIYIYIYTLYTYIYKHIHIYIHMYTHKYIHIDICVYIQIGLRVKHILHYGWALRLWIAVRSLLFLTSQVRLFPKWGGGAAMSGTLGGKGGNGMECNVM